MANETPLKQENQAGTIIQWRTSDLVQHFPVYTTLPQATPEERAWVLSCIECECRAGADLIGQEMWIGDFVIHPVEKHDPETGEVTILRRLVLIQPDGPPISFASDGVLKSINRLVYVIGQEPPWEPPLKVKLKQRNIGNGRRMFYFEKVKE
jgi:hypothetical protein